MHGAKNQILTIKKHLNDPNLSDVERAIIEREFGELSRMIDNAEEIPGEIAK